ncbi:MAG: hypothetical protein RIC80_17880 [Cyclobacteriaceae bacterium]
MSHILIAILSLLLSCGSPIRCNQESSLETKMTNQTKTCSYSNSCKAKNQSAEVSCKLTTPELRRRKESVVASLKQQILDEQELEDGYAFKFPGTDKVLDELTEFIKTERACCDFFVFGLSISGDKSEAWMEMTGTEGAKDFIEFELGLNEQ